MRRQPVALLLPAALLACSLAGCRGANDAPAAAGPAPAATDAPAAPAANPVLSGDAREELAAVFNRLREVKSYHATMDVTGGPGGEVLHTEMDHVAPDRYRVQATGGMTQVIIGDSMWIEMGGQTQKMPLPAGMMEKLRNPGNSEKLQSQEATVDVQAQGSERIDGTSMKKYVLRDTGTKPITVTYWVGDDGLPRRMLAETAEGTLTATYSRFNDPTIVIDTPQ